MNNIDSIDELKFIKQKLLTSLKFEHIAPANSDTFSKLEEFKTLMIKTRKNVAYAVDKDSIAESLMELRESFLQAWKPEHEKAPHNALRKAMQEFYFDSGIADPDVKLTKLSEAFQQEELSSFRITCQKLFSKLPNQSHKKHFSDMSPRDFLEINPPLNLDPDYPEIRTKASQIAQRFDLASICSDNDVKTVAKVSDFIKSLETSFEDGAKKMGMDEKCFGKHGAISYGCSTFTTESMGLFFTTKNTITIGPVVGAVSQASFNSTTLHEWIHAVDNNISLELHNYLSEKKALIPQGFYKSSFTSEITNAIELDSSKQAKAFQAFRDFTANVITADVEQLEKFKREEQVKLSTQFWHEALGATFYDISQSQRDTLNSPEVYQNIRNKILNPKNQEYGNNILATLTATAPQLIDEKVKFFIVEQTGSPLLDTARKDINKIEDFKAVGINFYIKGSTAADNLKNDVSKIRKLFSPNAQKAKTDNYYQSNLEAVARYVESQLNIKTAQFQNAIESVIHSKSLHDKIDPNFDKNRRALISAAFGESAVRDIQLPEETPVFTNFMKATGALLYTVGTILVLPVKAIAKLQDLKVATIENISDLSTSVLAHKIQDVAKTIKNVFGEPLQNSNKIDTPNIEKITTIKFDDSAKNKTLDSSIKEVETHFKMK